ncbi:hypothetical protein PsAD46_01287 [Pseudovibrio sp. Ad46]|nr:hypothetical protein PsAD46_01287 [Pseudovibrio sp. Ad46]
MVQTGAHIERYEFADGTTLSEIKVLNDGRLELHGTVDTDLIFGTTLGEILLGGMGSDTFVFSSVSVGSDVIADFVAGAGSEDVIRFSTNRFADFEDMLTAASDNGSDTVISLDDSNSVTLKGVQVSDLHIDDFQFT